MAKNRQKKNIIILIVLILFVIICCLYRGKNTLYTSIINKSKEASAPTEEDGTITYNTEGNDSANYKDGDIEGEKSEWVKNGDVWTYTFYVDDPNAEWYVWEDSSSLMPGYTSNHNEYNPDKLFLEEELSSFTPDDSMEISTNMDGKTEYTWIDSENSYKVIDNGDGTYKKITTRLSLTITNYKKSDAPVKKDTVIHYGELTINKIVKDSDGTILDENDDDKSFTFTITLVGNEENQSLVNGTKVFGDVVFNDGVATISLKADGTITIREIPEGLNYTVKENVIDGYDITCEGTFYGTITEESPSVVTYVNTKQEESHDGGSEVDEKYTSFRISKIVTGNGEVNDSVSIEISLNNLKANTEYTLSNGQTFTSDSVGSANVTIQLRNNESVIVQNIPVGSKYKVYEYAGDYISSYRIIDENNMGLISNSAKNNTKENKDLSTSTETADEGEEVTITFTNKKTLTQNLKVQKVVTDADDTNNYSFEIEFTNLEEGTSFNSSIGKVTEENGKAELTIYLAGGEEAEFYNVPVGTTYTIKELASNAIASYTITDSNGTNQIVKDSDANTVNKKALSTERETVNQGEEVTVTFINDTVNQEPDSVSTSIGVTKKVTNENNEVLNKNKGTYVFDLTSEDESNPMPEKTSVTIQGNGEASFGTVTFTEVGTYTYKIVERAGDNENCQYDSTEYTIVYEVTNTEGLLEITKTIKKNGFIGEVVEFKNIVTGEVPEPDDPENPDEPDDSGKSDEEKSEPKQEEKKSNSTKTGDNILITLFILIISGTVLIITLVKENKKQ